MQTFVCRGTALCFRLYRAPLFLCMVALVLVTPLVSLLPASAIALRGAESRFLIRPLATSSSPATSALRSIDASTSRARINPGSSDSSLISVTWDTQQQQQQQQEDEFNQLESLQGNGDDNLQRDRSREAIRFLLLHLPPMDHDKLPLARLKENVQLAWAARHATLWALKNVSWDIYLNYVLPHANMDEPRDNWRRMMYTELMPLVKDAGSLGEAALTLNRLIWDKWGIVFKPEKTPEIMSPSQVIAAGYASCTGLSIFLVNACRSVGIPARVVGTPDWAHRKHAAASTSNVDSSTDLELHNHNWVEIWDGRNWSFMGAAEYDPRGFNRTWFFPEPARWQVRGDSLHAIYAVSYKPTKSHLHFPLAWNLEVSWVNAEDVTQTYLDAADDD